MTGAAPDPEGAGTEQWQRLDPRMLVVHPVQELVRFLPVLIGAFVAGRATGAGIWQVLGVVVPVALGVLRYLTTRYRLTADRVELRTGLLQRRLLSTRVDRVRTVDLTASPTHRLLGLTTMRIGTGSTDEDGFDLDGLPVAAARRLREQLLGGVPADPAPAAEDSPVALRLDPRWVRYAPLTSTGLVAAAAALGVGAQVLDSLGAWRVLDVEGRPASLPALGLAAAGALVVAAAVSALAVVGYLAANWDLRLSHRGRSWHLRRGALTTRETTLDDDRVAGVTLAEPVGLRLAGAATVQAIVTGLDREERGSSTLVPPAPYAVAAGVAAAVLGSHRPLTDPLRPHGPAAVRRRWVRALGPAAGVAATTAALVLLAGTSPWLLGAGALALGVAPLLARDRAASLGHALTDRHLVARSGSVVRRREVLQTDAVIGWVLRETWTQRRAGLVTLRATTAGGDQAVEVPDLPGPEAVALASAATPGLVTQFRIVGPP
ncbi:PH domain-containing protein [Nocardioides pantholopis]|uniref:PH domain-containing protein n=1 Tax=Nocardioides pantholopis TaxID=2483798 RepID=UPI000FD8733B|nr:PH domain-containing protein [Nocardioides pantholopis]